MKIILAGYMGSGKSGVGQRLADKLRLPFLDLDVEISASENRSVTEIFKSSGEIYFRKQEHKVLQDLLASKENFVLALGGGTPCYANNLELIKNDPGAKLVYLKTSLQELTKRLFKERSTRPLISHLETPEILEDFIRKHLFERTYYYNQAPVIVETGDKGMDEVAEEILDRLN